MIAFCYTISHKSLIYLYGVVAQSLVKPSFAHMWRVQLKSQKRFISAVLTLVFFLWVGSSFATETIYIGVLENWPEQGSLDFMPPEQRPINKPGYIFDYIIPADVSVRVCFKKVKADWVLVKSLPTEISWTVTFDGKQIGKVTTQNSKDTYNSRSYRVGQQELIKGQTIPTMGKPSYIFWA